MSIGRHTLNEISSTKLHHEQRKARKEYKCQWCKWPILKDEKYISECWIVDGDFTYERHHLNYLGECMPKVRQDNKKNSPTTEKNGLHSHA